MRGGVLWRPCRYPNLLSAVTASPQLSTLGAAAGLVPSFSPVLTAAATALSPQAGCDPGPGPCMGQWRVCLWACVLFLPSAASLFDMV